VDDPQETRRRVGIAMSDEPSSDPPKRARATDRRLLRWAVLNPLLTVLAALVTIGLVARAVDGRWVYEPLHSAIEAAGSMLALAIAALLIWGRDLHERPYLDWVVAGLLVQCILDLVHAAIPLGPAFYWSRSLPTVLGGVLFALVWVPITSRQRPLLYATACGVALVASAGLVALPDAWPPGFSAGGHYASWARIISVASGTVYGASAVFFLREQQRKSSFADGVFASHALLMAVASGAFGLSSLWDGTWWAFHAVRLMAYVVSVGYVVDLLRRVARRRREVERAARVRADEAATKLGRELETAQGRSRRLAEQYAQRMAILVRASRAYAQAGLDLAAVHETVVRQMVADSYDSAALHRHVPGTDRFELAAIAHRDPELQAAMEDVLRREPMQLGEGIAGTVAATGESVLVPEVTLEALRDATRPAYARFVERYPIHGFVSVPIRAHGVLLGVLSVSRFVAEPRLEEEDRLLIEELADRAALAIFAAEQYAELGRNEAAIETALRFAEQFIGMLGHDLRNPLHAIQMAATLMRETAQGRDARVLARLLSSTRRMSNMVGQLLDLTRARLGGGIAVQRRPMDLATLVGAIVDELRPAYPGRELVQRLPPDATGEWDPDRLAQVVSTLVGNALAYGDPARPVEVRLAAEGERVRLAVQSHGPPIAPELLPVLFDPFRRSEARSLHAQGLGLGLYIAQQIVHAHGGRIDVRSTEAEGTVFEVTLPRVAAPAGGLLPSPP
jgi:signal transduction histidine kinase